MVLERVKRIAETGEIPADNPVANIMAQVNLPEQQSQDNSLWGSFKNWAGSKGGRMTLGGLSTALGVGLTGGNFKDALGYGIIGAGNTAKGIYNKEQDYNKLAQEYAKQQMYWQNAEKDRVLRKQLNDDLIQGRKDIVDLEYQKTMDRLTEENRLAEQREINAQARADERINNILEKAGLTGELANIARAGAYGVDMGGIYNTLNNIDAYKQGAREREDMAIINNPNSTPEEVNAAVERRKQHNQLMQSLTPVEPITLGSMGGLAKNIGKTFTNESLNKAIQTGNPNDLEFTDKPTDDLKMIQAYMAEGMTFDEARQTVGNLSPQEKMQNELLLAQGKSLINIKEHAANAGVDYTYENMLKENDWLRDMDAKKVEQEYKKQLEKYIRSLPTDEQRDIQWRADALGQTVAEYLRPEMEKRTAEALKAQREAGAAGQPSFGELQTGVNSGTISAQTANQVYGQNVFTDKPQQSTFDKKVEENRAKAFSEQEEKLRNFKASMPLIEKNVNKLMDLSDKATYTWAGNLYNEGRKQLGLSATEGAVARAEMENIIENNVLPQLRALLGAQFTEREGERVKQTIMDPNRTPEERKAQLRNYLDTKYEEMAQAARNLQTYSQGNDDPMGIL